MDCSSRVPPSIGWEQLPAFPCDGLQFVRSALAHVLHRLADAAGHPDLLRRKVVVAEVGNRCSSGARAARAPDAVAGEMFYAGPIVVSFFPTAGTSSFVE